MSEKYKRFLIPGVIIAVVLVIYYLIKTTPQNPIVSAQSPQPGGSGVAPLPAQSQVFDVGTPNYTPAPPTSLNTPSRGSTNYLFYNQAPVAKPDKKSSCGCNSCETCSQGNSRMPDGSGGALAYDKAAQINNTPEGVFGNLYQNLVSSGLLDPITIASFFLQQAELDAGGVPAGALVI